MHGETGSDDRNPFTGTSYVDGRSGHQSCANINCEGVGLLPPGTGTCGIYRTRGRSASRNDLRR